MLILLVALATGVIATIAARAIAHRFGIVSHPNPIVPQHTKPIAYLGGAGMAAAALVAIACIQPRPPLAFVVAPALFLILGLVDDLRPFSAATKLVLQIVAAILTALVLGHDVALAVAWIVVCVNAFNLIDVCDGLLAGVGAIAFGAWSIADPAHAPIALAFAGACAGFLVFNFPDASIFAGDAGSHVLGASFAVLTVSAAPLARPRVALAAVVAAAVPLFETAFVMVMRIRKRRPWWRGSRDHFSLRLQSAGWTKRQTVLASYAAAAFCGAAAIVVMRMNAIVAIAVLVAAVVAWWRLAPIRS